MNVYEKLHIVQQQLKCNKSQYNSFGKYNYRNCEDILEGVKPLLDEVKAVLVVSDEIVFIEGRFYVKATAQFIDAEKENQTVSNTAYAREEESKKGMDASQVTGATSSYARKYALNGLFCIDDTKDADSMDNNKKEPAYKCEHCGTPFTDFDYKERHYTAKDGYEIAKRNCNGHAYCNKCKKELCTS